MIRLPITAAIIVLLSLVAGCAFFKDVQKGNTEDRFVSVGTLIAAVQKRIYDDRVSGVISKEQSIAYQEKLDNAREKYIEARKVFLAGDVATSDKLMELVENYLIDLQRDLNEKARQK